MKKTIYITQRSDFHSKRKEWTDSIDQNWIRLLEECNFLPVPVPNSFRVAKNLYEKIKPQGLILSGGNDIASARGGSNKSKPRDKVETWLLSTAIKNRIPVLGICRGLQLIVDYFGGKVSPVNNHVRVMHKIKRTKEARLPFGKINKVNSYHNFGVIPEDVPPQLRISYLCEDGTVEALEHQTKRISALMWHPERKPMTTNHKKFLKRFFS